MTRFGWYAFLLISIVVVISTFWMTVQCSSDMSINSTYAKSALWYDFKTMSDNQPIGTINISFMFILWFIVLCLLCRFIYRIHLRLFISCFLTRLGWVQMLTLKNLKIFNLVGLFEQTSCVLAYFWFFSFRAWNNDKTWINIENIPNMNPNRIWES